MLNALAEQLEIEGDLLSGTKSEPQCRAPEANCHLHSRPVARLENPAAQLENNNDRLLNTKPRVVVIGSSGHARAVVDALEEEGRYHVSGLLDTYKLPGTEILGYRTLGTEEDLAPLLTARFCECVIVAIGDNWSRGQVVERIRRLAENVSFATVIHPSARVARGVVIGPGTVIMAGAIVNTGCRVGEFCILNTGSSLDHDSVLADFSSLAPRAVTGGGVRIGAYSAIAIGAVVSHEINIGEQTVIGAGATVLEDISSYVLAYGTPAQVIRKRIAGEPYLKSPAARPETTASSETRRGLPVSPQLSIFGVTGNQWQDWLARTSHDFFHTGDYHRIEAEVTGGTAQLAIYGTPEKFVAWPYLLKPISEYGNPVELTTGSPLQDVTSVYGYSGPLAKNCEDDESFLNSAWAAILDQWSNQGVVSAFTRFHPLFNNYSCFGGGSRVAWKPGPNGKFDAVGKTVAIDLSNSAEDIWNGYSRQARQALRKCANNSITVTIDPEWNHFEDFVRIYYGTMKRNQADGFYFFPTRYLRALQEAAGTHGSLMVASVEGTVISAALLLEYDGVVNLHLLATDNAFVHLSPSKVVVHAAQQWAKARGNHTLHLGGGRGGRTDDSLFRFKAMFSSRFHSFHVGRCILNKAAYDCLAEKRRKDALGLRSKKIDPLYFPVYRAPFIEAVECHDNSAGV